MKKLNWKRLAVIGIVLVAMALGGCYEAPDDPYVPPRYYSELYAWTGAAWVDVGASLAGGGGSGLWEVDGTETQLIVADELDIQNKSILNVLDIDGVDIGTLDTTVSSHTTSIGTLQAVSHTQNTDIGLGALGTKNPPIDADKVIYRDSTNSDALVTSTWTQVKTFLKSYFDGSYPALADFNTLSGTVSSHTTALANLIIGTDVQAWDDDLDDIAGLTPTDGNFIVGDGADWTTESGATARASLDVYSTNETDAAIDASIAPHAANIADNAGNITALKEIGIVCSIDGGGSAITTGEKGHLEIPFDCTITGWTLLADQSGSIVIDVWNDTYANFPPTVADTIAGSEKPTLSAVQKNQDLALGTWTTSVDAGDILAFNVDSASTVERVTLTITATRAI